MYLGWEDIHSLLHLFLIANVLLEKIVFRIFFLLYSVFVNFLIFSSVYFLLQVSYQYRKCVSFTHVYICVYVFLCYGCSSDFILFFSPLCFLLYHHAPPNFIRQRHKANSIHKQRTACKSSHTQASNNIYSSDKLESRSGPHLSPKTMGTAVPNLSRHGTHVLDFLTSHNPKEGSLKSPLCS